MNYLQLFGSKIMRASSILTSLWEVIGKAFQSLIQVTFYQNDEVKVWQRTDRQGNAYWCVYDPKTGHSANFGSEEEVMNWIESHYYL